MAPFTMPLAFTQLWGLDGTIMNLLDAILPGSKLFVTFLIVGMLCLFAYFFVHEIKDPFKNLKEIMSIMAAIGGFSLLLTGNMFALLVLEIILVLIFGGYRAYSKRNESTPKEGEDAIRRTNPDILKRLDDLEAARKTTDKPLSAKDAKTASEEARLGHDLSVLQKDAAAMAAIGKETAGRVAELAKKELTAEQREAAMLEILLQHAQQLKTDLGKTHSTVGAEQQGRQQMNNFLAVFEPDCKRLLDEELAVLKTSAENATVFLQHVEILAKTAKRASDLEWIIGKVIDNLKRKGIGEQTIFALKEKVKALRKAAVRASPNVAEQARFENEANALEGSIAATDALKATFLNTLNAIRLKAKELSTLNEPLKNTKGKLHADDIKKAAATLLPLEKPLKAYADTLLAKTQELQKSQQPPETYGAILIPLAHDLFNKLIDSRQKRNAFDDTLHTVLTECNTILSTETVITEKIAEIQILFAQAEEQLGLLNEASETAIGKPTEQGALAKAKSALDYVNQAKREIVHGLITDAQRGITAALQILDQRRQASALAIENAKKRHETIIQTIREMSTNLSQEQIRILKLSEVRYKKGQAETEAAFKRANAA